MWLVALASRNYQELYNTLGYVVNDKIRNKILKDVIEMFSDGFLLCEWEKEKLDALVALEREDNIKERATRIGLKQGIKQGIERDTIKIIKAMLQENCSFDFISKITGKSIEEIKIIDNI